jgi:hypothetical protein
MRWLLLAFVLLLLAGCVLEVDARYNRGQEILERPTGK